MHSIGYIALATNLASSAMKNTLHLRVLACLGNSLYIVYGLEINSPPVYWGGAIATLIHSYYVKTLLWAPAPNEEDEWSN